ncbi:hypothetical protein FQR60_001495 [Escherichia coli]|nr:hypothetical protein [Escherichia coli]ELT8669783.1 hypothetical protein [Escherichia coli]
MKNDADNIIDLYFPFSQLCALAHCFFFSMIMRGSRKRPPHLVSDQSQTCSNEIGGGVDAGRITSFDETQLTGQSGF